ncbi:MAG: MBL fold metallo-hydrolase [Pseudomonadota bacterium]|nr:MBL fold metallo-hydrolase [Pseudomonadota bacterium]
MTLRLEFHGAARTITGSCYVLDTGASRVMFDCGMFQGSKTESELNYRPFPFVAEDIDALVLTHAHIDHSGLVPKLVKHGFAGTIHATAATSDLCSIMLPDSGYIQETEVRKLNERNRRRGLPEVMPVYTAEDAQRSLSHFSHHGYGEWFEPAAGLRARFWNAGHLMGSASIEVEAPAAGSGKPIRILFSGDIGPAFKLLQPDPEAPSGLDYVICEATYGAIDRRDNTESTRRDRLAGEVMAARARGGALLIPSFAVERTQEIMTDLAILIEAKRLPDLPVFIDSPLAFKATGIFNKYAVELQNGDQLLKAFASPHVRMIESVDESKALNRLQGFHIVIAASGMCEAGRIRHHLKNRLWQPSATVLLAGYQAQGTLGRLLQEGVKRVKIHGEEIEVRATIDKIDDYSGHADGPELHAWMKARLPVRGGVFLTHGEEEGMDGLTRRLVGDVVASEHIFRPALDERFDISGAVPMLLPAEKIHRAPPEAVGHPDWHNDLAQLTLAIGQVVAKAANDQARKAVIRKLHRALEQAGAGD